MNVTANVTQALFLIEMSEQLNKVVTHNKNIISKAQVKVPKDERQVARIKNQIEVSSSCVTVASQGLSTLENGHFNDGLVKKYAAVWSGFSITYPKDLELIEYYVGIVDLMKG